MKNARDIIIRPLITECSTEMMEHNKYTFIVSRVANKVEIRKAVEEIFGVKVQAVNTINMKGKKRRLGRHPEGKKPAFKKAIIRLTDDSKSIDIL